MFLRACLFGLSVPVEKKQYIGKSVGEAIIGGHYDHQKVTLWQSWRQWGTMKEGTEKLDKYT